MQQCRYHPCFRSKTNKMHLFFEIKKYGTVGFTCTFTKKNNKINEKHALFTNAYMHPNKEYPVIRKTRIRCGNFKFKLLKRNQLLK